MVDGEMKESWNCNRLRTYQRAYDSHLSATYNAVNPSPGDFYHQSLLDLFENNDSHDTSMDLDTCLEIIGQIHH